MAREESPSSFFVVDVATAASFHNTAFDPTANISPPSISAMWDTRWCWLPPIGVWGVGGGQEGCGVGLLQRGHRATRRGSGEGVQHLVKCQCGQQVFPPSGVSCKLWAPGFQLSIIINRLFDSLAIYCSFCVQTLLYHGSVIHDRLTANLAIKTDLDRKIKATTTITDYFQQVEQ